MPRDCSDKWDRLAGVDSKSMSSSMMVADSKVQFAGELCGSSWKKNGQVLGRNFGLALG